MVTSISCGRLSSYLSAQLNSFFPDDCPVNFNTEYNLIKLALDRLEFCFQNVTLQHYYDGKDVRFNHLFSDHYVMFLWYLANSVWKEKGNCSLANKIYYLNKVLNGLDCMYDTQMPDIFLIFHGGGTMLGKAEYSNFFVVLQGCTVGSQKGNYPKFGKAVSLTANSSVIGNCKIGNRTTISTRTTIFEKNIDNDKTVYMNWETGKYETKETKKCYAQQFFNTNLKIL